MSKLNFWWSDTPWAEARRFLTFHFMFYFHFHVSLFVSFISFSHLLSFQKMPVHGFQTNSTSSDPEIDKNIVFLKCYIFGYIFGSSRNVQKGIAICLEVKINNLGIIKTLKNPLWIPQNPKTNQTQMPYFGPDYPVLGPVTGSDCMCGLCRGCSGANCSYKRVLPFWVR